MEEDIKTVENIIVEYSTQVEDYKFFSVPVRLDERDIEALENLLKRYKELEEENKNYKKYAVIMSTEGLLINGVKFSFNEFIPISVIQNKLEKLKREFDFYAGREHFEWQDGEFDGEVCDDIALKIGVLKELLEERNK